MREREILAKVENKNIQGILNKGVHSVYCTGSEQVKKIKFTNEII